MIEYTAVVWIRDGVLVDRMPENAVAFALASLQHIPYNKRDGICIEDLIKWGFEKSGVSAAEKMQLFNVERQDAIKDIAGAAAYYTALAIGVESLLEYFDGSVELLIDLYKKGAKHYITSAIDQEVLDMWRQSEQGRVISDYLCEILGSRSGFQKGRNHFSRIESRGATRIYYIADAVSEIQTGSECADCGVIPVGFVNVITGERIVEAFRRLRKAETRIGWIPRYSSEIDDIYPDKLVLPDASKLSYDLTQAGAKALVRGSKKNIIGDLRNYFFREGII